ncbi:hypothetical protein MATL_G00100000 [Megalops atlanticus]|uniref:Uncharacterized protein n=1 Tax=Megalops atlanticus TaxID=7932 RepID=A0A9D3Q1L1_MEGAT|nr:hypothetical protein MATL_G00100000 [Megalops atlanticus]
MHVPADQDELQLVLDAGVAMGRCGDGEPHPPGRVKVDNYLDLTDFNEEEEDLGISPVVLPWEVDEDLPAYMPSLCHHTRLELRTCQRPHRQLERLSGQLKQRRSCLSAWMKTLITIVLHCPTSTQHHKPGHGPL